MVRFRIRRQPERPHFIEVAELVPDAFSQPGYRWISFYWDERHLDVRKMDDLDVSDWEPLYTKEPEGSWSSPMDVIANQSGTRIATAIPQEMIRPGSGLRWMSWWFLDGVGLTVELVPEEAVKDWKAVFTRSSAWKD